ncbi:unnamed protein product [Rotaria sp. Silwood1]|nr:unnamed protein product [Rotaria sp. Silwood1]CAF1654654.1 unnamed protein product [Rotaria sp. Silwood1]CAF3799564.1 unnamed protein product [Rotaria sp. Silwood1]CAF3860595.1 unnamed protein product [Rotaria sp. Silwood1]CAF4858456.1 unnamed protein product [Rotaria sp. Silwood1]
MRSNRALGEGFFNIPPNKRAEACQRRGADLIERIAVIFQNIFDTLKVLEPIKSIQFNKIQKNTLNEIKTNISTVFYSNNSFTEVDDEPAYPDGIDLKNLDEVQITSVKKAPLQSMKIELSAAKAAVHFFHKLLLPQSIQLFCTDSIDNKKATINELKIIQHPINCFSMNDITYNGIFHNHKRDNIDVKQILLNLEKKHLLKRGKFVKVGSRLIESWIKLLPEPTNDEQIRYFQNELNINYQLELEKYIDYYEDGIDQKSSLTEESKRILLAQRSWIEQLRRKIHSSAFQQNSSESTTRSSTKEMQQVEHIVYSANAFQDIVDSFTHDTIDLQTTCLNTSESANMFQHMNISSVIESCNEVLMGNNKRILGDNQLHENIIHDCLSDVTERVADLVGATHVTMIDPTTDQNKTIDTKNSTYLTPHGMSILKQKPYNDLKIMVNEDNIVQPAKERYRQLFDSPHDNHRVDKENCECIPFLIPYTL